MPNYYWEGVDIADITGTSSTNSNINGHFSNFPGNTANVAEISTQDGITTNATTFNSLPTPNTSYFCYNDEEDTDAPGYTLNGKSIFTNNFSNQRLIVSNTSLSSNAGSGTLSIPSWCNGIKIVFRSIKGSDGSAGSAVSGSNYNADTHYDDDYNYNQNNNINTNFIRRNNRNNHHNNRHNHHDQAHNWSAKSGGAKGIGGLGRIGWFLKGIKFTAGANNTIDYSISTTAASNSTIRAKENGSVITDITIKNGGNGGNGGNAASKTTDNKNANANHNKGNSYGDHNNHNNNENHYNHRHGSTAGGAGGSGDIGTVEFDGTTPTYLYYNNPNTSESTMVTIYYFRYQSS